MTQPKSIVLTIINDINYDQRMIRICTSLAHAGYDVLLVGRAHSKSKPLIDRPFRQHRIKIKQEQGKLMYLLYWWRLFWFLYKQKADALCAIDLDTILPVYAASKLKGVKRVYDAHELFTELQEVVTRKHEKRLWDWIEAFSVPRFPVGYTIGDCYADTFKQKYQVDYTVVRNATVLRPLPEVEKTEPYILYQGAVNIGRCFEYLIPAMKQVSVPLVVCGAGNFFEQAQQLVAEHGLQDKVFFKGYIPPAQLPDYTRKATIGITLFEALGLSNRLSMANRFFDYMHHAIPQLCMNYPEYKRVNEQYEIACLIDEPNEQQIADALNKMLGDREYLTRLSANCLEARKIYCWQEEEKKLLGVYQRLFQGN